MKRCIITTTGDMQAIPASTIVQIEHMLNARALDTVSFRYGLRIGVQGEDTASGEHLILTIPAGSVMLVDDQGHAKNLPVNFIATGAYRAKCHPNPTDHEIRGDVVIVPDEDFA